MAKIAVLGCGFGAALAALWSRSGHEVTAWTKFQDEIDAIKRDGENKKLLPGIKLPPEINFTADISAIKDSDILVFAIPSEFVRETAQKAAQYISPDTIILSAGKGFERGTKKRQSEVIAELIPGNKIAVMAGPCHAEEVGRGIPTTVVCASDCTCESAQFYIQDTLQSESFRIYLSDDIIGCELGGALKNTIALCCGITQGMGLGSNTVAALMTRGLAEITRLSVALGARWQTFTGLSGIGDLIVTCTSELSRNHRAGKLIGGGLTACEAIEKTGTVEGYGCARCALELADMHNVDVPIIEQLYRVLFEDIKPAEALKELMSRPSRHEQEEYWNCCDNV
ncbi:MAG: NAD(P)-dependent glycerol-3-phosphate dehydrogenase [Oscillospiraceae bacterium]|jgi:glycerol-3-phosphate dehydrogenase (NAD(P)+)|nr:NAD(P)-dependent glycerol-3-phosphate dehydrogenase [Oscillospiraceae bacterium]